MQEVTCKSGKVYGIALGYGMLESLQGVVLELLPDATFERIKEELIAEKGMENLSTLDFIEKLDGSELKSFFLANNRQVAHTIAKCIRTMDGNPIGNNFQVRNTFVEEELDWNDGTEIAVVLANVLKEMKEGQEVEGESELSSNDQIRRARKGARKNPNQA